MPSKDKRKLAAIMFADVVGYSRMMASNEERTLELLKDFENICSPIISKHDGEIIKKVGDELFCEFSSAKQAVDSALAIQEAIQPYNDSRPKDFKLQVRIGIHVGDIVLRDGDVFGDGVNVASRIQPFANPGGICVSNAVRDAISSHPNYDIKSEGQQELKNIIEKHTLYSIKTGFEDKTTIRKYKKSKKTIPVLIGILAVCIAGILFFGDSLNIWTIEKGSEEIYAAENIYLSKIRSSLVDMQVFGDSITYKGRVYQLSPISEEQKTDLDNSILSSVLPVLNKIFSYNLHQDLVQNMAMKGTLPLDYDYRYQHAKRLATNDIENSKAFVDTYEGSTNQFQIESDIHTAIYLNIYKAKTPGYDIDNYISFIFVNRLIGNILGRGETKVSFNDTIRTNLYDIGIIQQADGTNLFHYTSIEEIPMKLSFQINKILQTWIDSKFIRINNNLQAKIKVIEGKNIIIKHNDTQDEMKINMTFNLARLYHSSKNGATLLKEDILKYKDAIQGNDSLMNIYQESDNLNGYTNITCGFYQAGEAQIKVIEKYDTTARCIVIEENPFRPIKKGDQLFFK